MKNLDRLGNERCAGYRQADFAPCSRCQVKGLPLREPRTNCPECGGYGEAPKATSPKTGDLPATENTTKGREG